MQGGGNEWIAREEEGKWGHLAASANHGVQAAELCLLREVHSTLLENALLALVLDPGPSPDLLPPVPLRFRSSASAELKLNNFSVHLHEAVS